VSEGYREKYYGCEYRGFHLQRASTIVTDMSKRGPSIFTLASRSLSHMIKQNVLVVF